MAQSPFDGQHATFVLLGLTDDRFCLRDTRLVDLPTYLDIHLRSIGFTQLAFHHPLDGVRIIGQPTEPHSRVTAPSGASAIPETPLVRGPLGQMKVLSPRTPSSDRTPSSPGRRDLARMTDAELPSFLEQFCAGDGRRVFVFQDFEYLMDFNPQALATLWAVLRRIQTRSTGMKKIIFLSNSRSIDTLRSGSNNRHFLSSFGDQFFHDGAVRPNVIFIGPPGADEILSLQRRFRLRSHLLTNFSSLAQHCEAKAAELRARTDLFDSSLKNNKEELRDHDWTTAGTTESALTRLEALPGRGDVAARIRRDVEYARKQNDSRRFGDGRTPETGPSVERLLDHSDDAPPAAVNLSYALAGNPGTGKTIIARLIAEAFKEAGVLRSGHFIEATVQDLVGEYVGQTAMKANNLLSRARGGVLFIDEVQGFEKDNQFHREAIRTILKYVEDYRGDISVIVATYADRMDEFLSIDDGLSRRFTQRLDLGNYDPITCVRIFTHIAAGKKVTVASDLQEKLEGFFEAWIDDRAKKDAFSNAGSVRNLLEDMDRARFDRDGVEAPLSVQDIPEKYQRYVAQATQRTGSVDERIEAALEELDAMVGLEGVKRTIRSIVNRIKAARLRGKAADIYPGHYSFEGNPGTGKTTVARLLGDLFRELGLLKSGHVVEVTRSDLVAQYSGQTAPLVRQRTGQARDGVLLIDEAHNLIQDDRDGFGKEAIGELTAILENERNHLCVIAAGYSEPMERLFAQDPGWNSRFSGRIHFADFGLPEMDRIMRLMCGKQDLTLHAALERNLQGVFARLRELEGADFGNGRSVRRLLENMHANLDQRVVDGKAADPNQLVLDDVPRELQA